MPKKTIRKSTPQLGTILSYVFLAVVIIGSVIAFILNRQTQDNRQQASGGIQTIANCRGLYSTRPACEAHSDICFWQQVGTTPSQGICGDRFPQGGRGEACNSDFSCIPQLRCINGTCQSPPPNPGGGGPGPGGSGNPGNGNTCSADCHPNAANCGVYGKTSAPGSCQAGYICCRSIGGGSNPPTPTAPPTPASTVRGYFDNVDNGSCTYISGWTCDSKSFDKPLRLAVYVDSFAQDRVIDEAAPLATIVRNDLTVRECNGTTAHGFRVDLTTARAKNILTKGVNHTLLVKAVGLSGTAGNYVSDPNKGPFVALPSAGVTAPTIIRCN